MHSFTARSAVEAQVQQHAAREVRTGGSRPHSAANPRRAPLAKRYKSSGITFIPAFLIDFLSLSRESGFRMS